MSYGCMFVLRAAKDFCILYSDLLCAANAGEYGLCFEPGNNLLLEHSVELHMNDLAFEVCDNFGNSNASILLSRDGWTVNGKQARIPLKRRLKTIQDIALICARYAKVIEIYLGEDTPYLPDYFTFKLTCAEIADTLYNEYQKDSSTPFIPCVHIVIET